MKLRTKIGSIIAAAFLFCSTASYAGNSFIASGEASEDMSEAAYQLASATGNLSSATLQLSGDTALVMGKAVGKTILTAAEISGDTITFSADVLADGLITTAQLSADLTMAGVNFSASIPIFVADAASAGIHLSTDTAALFLSQAVEIAAASGRLSGEAAKLAVSLTMAGVEFSVDSAILVVNAAAAGIEISEEGAANLISASLAIGAECIEAAVIAERYIVMTVADANTLLKEASLAALQSTVDGTKKAYIFSRNTAAHLRSLGIDGAKYAQELSLHAAQKSTTAAVKTIKGADDAIVVAINTGSSLVIASIHSLTDNIEKSTSRLN